MGKNISHHFPNKNQILKHPKTGALEYFMSIGNNGLILTYSVIIDLNIEDVWTETLFRSSFHQQLGVFRVHLSCLVIEHVAREWKASFDEPIGNV